MRVYKENGWHKFLFWLATIMDITAAIKIGDRMEIVYTNWNSQ